MGLCLVTAFAISAVATATASAVGEPEFYTAKNTCTGKFGHLAYKNECVKVEKKAQAISFTEEGGVANLEGKLKIECKENTGKGKIEGGTGATGADHKANRISKLKTTFKNCVETGTTTECTKTFSVPKTIVTENVKGTLLMASEKSPGATVVAQELEPESATKGFANFKCGTSTNFITVKALGHLIISAIPDTNTGEGGVVPTPDETKLAKKGATEAEEKATLITGCGHQKLLFVNGTGPCLFLEIVENGTNTGASWNIFKTNIDYKTKKVETVEKGEF